LQKKIQKSYKSKIGPNSTKSVMTDIEGIFKKCDINGDGHLDKNEATIFFGTIFDALYKKGNKYEMINEWITHFDKDKNGTLDYQEFVQAVTILLHQDVIKGKQDIFATK